MRIGILGGTFDPPHNGHLLLARAAKMQLHLDRVLFAPAGLQPFKQDRQVSSAEQRAEMVTLAIAGEAAFQLSRIDLDRPGPHYTVDLLRIASGVYPDMPLWFIMGGDLLIDLPRWRDPRRLIELARLAVLRRPGLAPDWAALEATLPGLWDCVDWIDMPPTDVSAHDIRRRVREGESIAGLVPPAVAQYIVEKQLYRSEERRL